MYLQLIPMLERQCDVALNTAGHACINASIFHPSMEYT